MGYESDDSWDNLSHTHEHTHMHNIVALLTLRRWRNSPRRASEQQQFRQQSTTNVQPGMHRTPDPWIINHMEGASAANKRFVPEPTA